MGDLLKLMAVGVASAAVGAGGGVVWTALRPQPVAAEAAPTDLSVAPPKTLDAVLQTAERAMLDADPSKAVTVLEAAVRQHEGDPALWLALARARTRLPDGALGAYEAYQSALRTGSQTAQNEFEAGTAASRAGLDQAALEHYRAAEALEPQDPRFPLYAAQVLLRLGATDEARGSLFRATRLDEHLAIAWGSLGELALRENRPSVALQYIARAREQEPRVTAWRVIEARAHNRMGSPQEALAALDGINDAEQLSGPVLRLYGETAALLNRPRDAAERYAQAVLARPKDAELALETAVWFERAGDGASALRLARHARMLGHEPAEAMVKRLEGQE